jgi:hypothetical protein
MTQLRVEAKARIAHYVKSPKGNQGANSRGISNVFHRYSDLLDRAVQALNTAHFPNLAGPLIGIK